MTLQLQSKVKPRTNSSAYLKETVTCLVAHPVFSQPAASYAIDDNFNVDDVRGVKVMEGCLSGSGMVQGVVFDREPEGTSTPVIKPRF
jgi:hypothetical protein